MPSPSLTRTTTFRLTAAFAGMFGAAIILLLGLVYVQTAGFLSRRVDLILTSEAVALSRTTPEAVLKVINEEAARDPLAGFILYSQSGERVAGRSDLAAGDLPLDGIARDVSRRGRAPERALATRLPWGEILIVERDTSQLVELRRTVVQALLWSGGLIIVLGVFLAIGLSLAPLRRVRATQRASEAIAAGDLSVRLPIDGSRDELDELARIVNDMMDEVERLITQARTVGEGVAHELRTPLTRLRATLEHAGDRLEAEDPRRALLEACVAETDGVLARFRGLLRIAAVETRGRKSGIGQMDLSAALNQAVELYQPLAADHAVELTAVIAEGVNINADTELMFELVSNLIDNALKFTPAGGGVRVSLKRTAQGPQLEVRDNGPGIAPGERGLVTQRFYRSAEASHVPGHGLGLSLVAAVADLHGFVLTIGDAHPGTWVRLVCRPDRATSEALLGAQSGGRVG